MEQAHRVEDSSQRDNGVFALQLADLENWYRQRKKKQELEGKAIVCTLYNLLV